MKGDCKISHYRLQQSTREVEGRNMKKTKMCYVHGLVPYAECNPYGLHTCTKMNKNVKIQSIVKN